MFAVLLLATTGCNEDNTEGPAPPSDVTTTLEPELVPASGGEVTIVCTIENPVKTALLEARTDDEWVTELTVLEQESTVTAVIAANEESEERTATVTLSYNGKEYPVEIPQQGYAAPFELTATELTHCDALISVVPDDKEATYYSNVAPAEGFDAETIAAWNLASFTTAAETEGISLAEYLASVTRKGDAEYHPERLTPETAYVAYAYGIDQTTGAATGEVIVCPFESQPVPEGEMSGCTIAITTQNLTSTSVTVIFTPSDPSVYYYYDMLDAKGYEAVRDNMPSYLYNSLIEQVSDFWSLEQVIKYSCATGEKSVQSRELTPETTYYALAAGVNLEGLINTEVAVLEITTPEDTPIDYGFNFTVGEVTATGAALTVTPNDPRAFYYWDLMTEAEYAELNGDEAKIAEYFTSKMDAKRIEQYGDYASFFPLPDYIVSQCSEGTDDYTYSTLSPATTYYPYAFWIDRKSGELASETAFGEPFTTKELELSSAAATPTLWLTDGDDWAELDPQGYLYLRGMAILGARLTPNSSAVHWYSNIYKASDIASTDDLLLGSSLINSRYYMDKSSYNLSYGVAWDNTEYVIVSIAVDAEGNRGELQKVPFRVDKSLAEELTELP